MIVLIIPLTGASEPVAAQGLGGSPLGFLFPFLGKKKAKAHRPSTRGYGFPGDGGNQYAPYSLPGDGYYSYGNGYQNYLRPVRRRTMCVRTCDGYYWPISRHRSSGGIWQDRGICQSSCLNETRLFYMSGDPDDIANMRDAHGRLYQELPNAFRYRKELVANCRCRPDPWSSVEKARHQRYAAIEQRRAKRLTAIKNGTSLENESQAGLAGLGANNGEGNDVTMQRAGVWSIQNGVRVWSHTSPGGLQPSQGWGIGSGFGYNSPNDERLPQSQPKTRRWRFHFDGASSQR